MRYEVEVRYESRTLLAVEAADPVEAVTRAQAMAGGDVSARADHVSIQYVVDKGVDGERRPT